MEENISLKQKLTFKVQEAREILSEDKDKFISFIEFCSRFYKYKYIDIISIYSQNSNAKAVADYKTWKKVGYQVRKREKGILLFDNTKNKKVRFVFDVSSTYQQSIGLWKYDIEKHKSIKFLEDKHLFQSKYLRMVKDQDVKNLLYEMYLYSVKIRLGLENNNIDVYKENIDKGFNKINTQNINYLMKILSKAINTELRSIEKRVKEFERNQRENINYPPFFVPKNTENQNDKESSAIKQREILQAPTKTPQAEVAPAPPVETQNQNYILNNKVYPEGSTKKIEANIEAIKTLLSLERGEIELNEDAKDKLSSYVGWGGLPQVFVEPEKIRSLTLKKQAEELKGLMTPKEYDNAKASTLNAHYTPSLVIEKMYECVQGFGYKNSIKILEPSCGIGNFIGKLPPELRKSNVTGVELDEITGRIAKMLYPQSKIKINGFENEDLEENSFDLVIGNVPFGEYSIYDKKYNKNNYLIHDYFINKSIELTKPNGIVAIITSKGTLDKKDDTFRREIAKKAELIAAMRLPNSTFKKIANTEVTSDILFFKKLEKVRDEIPSWIQTSELQYENRINNYFIENPGMVLGELGYKQNRYGRMDLTVTKKNLTLEEDFEYVIENNVPKNIVNQLEINQVTLDDIDIDDDVVSKDIDFIKSNSKYKPYRYVYLNDNIYYKNSDNSVEYLEDVKSKQRLIEIIKLRDKSKELIDSQLENISDEDFKVMLSDFNKIYDSFVAKYGYINTRANINIFKDDDDINFLTSLEKKNKDIYEKNSFFYKKTISPNIEITSVSNAKDGLILSINKYANINFEYIKSLYGKETEEIIKELIEDDLIYLNPLKFDKNDLTKGWELKSVYLNGNVKNKLKIAETLEKESQYFQRNIRSLKEVIPKNIDFSDIIIDIGSDLYKEEDMKQFAKELLNLSYEPNIIYNKKSSEWKIYNKGMHSYLAKKEYGTERIGALFILEKILNNTQIVVKDEIEDVYGNKRHIQNKEETIKANDKKLLIESKFNDFINENKPIRDRIVTEYNERFNNTINSNFDLNLTVPNLSPDIELRQHQKRAIARSIFNPSNLLLDHEVGAGKTFIMIASAMESKRLGICNKPLIVVPNNIMTQFKNDFYGLYPFANILYADEKSFQTSNRKKFLSKISLNDYDAVIMGQSQFDLVKISKERRVQGLQNEIQEIVDEISQYSRYSLEDRASIKSLEKSKKVLEKNLQKLLDSKEETLLSFEELGVDRLYVDEAHLYKNLYFYTKLRNIAGLNQTASQKAQGLKMKIDYLEEIGGKVIFSTGTPISNTMAEMYTMQRYLMQNKLKEEGIYNFDCWQKIFASTQSKLEISPTGMGFQLKTRFSNFRNIPELMKMYNSVADVVTTDMINLPLPKANKDVIQAEPSQELKEKMTSFAKRAEACKNGSVDPKIDNMLKIVNEGRHAGLDIRHINEGYEDYENSKINLVVNQVHKIYKETMDNKSTQVIFSDLSTPKDDRFNVYDDIKNKLITKGIPEEEIAFVHTAKDSKQRELMFEAVRNGSIRVIIGSTSKMGAGTNFQDKLIALYHLDTPWRPSDLQQREGRIIRQGNINKEVQIFKCITKGSFDAYAWQILEQKQRFIAQAKTGAITGREVKDIDDISIDYAEIKALATGNPLIKRKMEIDVEIDKLKVLETSFMRKKFENERFIYDEHPRLTTKLNEMKQNLITDKAYADKLNFSENNFKITIKGNNYHDKETAGAFLLQVVKESEKDQLIGEYKGFNIYSAEKKLDTTIKLVREGKLLVSLNNGYKKANIDMLDEHLKNIENNINKIDERQIQLDTKKAEMSKSINTQFEHKEELENLLKERLEIERDFDKENKTVVEVEQIEIESLLEEDLEL